MQILGLMLTSLIVGLSYTASAHAYLDPGTGSIILQGLLAVIAGTAITLKMYWARIRDFFKREKAGPEPHED